MAGPRTSGDAWTRTLIALVVVGAALVSIVVISAVANPEFKALIEANGQIAENATVADARRVMASIEYCNDVFVTSTGKRDERAIGWLTNTLLAGVQ